MDKDFGRVGSDIEFKITKCLSKRPSSLLYCLLSSNQSDQSGFLISVEYRLDKTGYTLVPSALDDRDHVLFEERLSGHCF